MSKRPSARRQARRRHPSEQLHPFADDGCPVCVALRDGDQAAAIEAMFGQPGPGGHRVVHEQLPGEPEVVRLLAHGSEWVRPDDGEAVPCPECGELVVTL